MIYLFLTLLIILSILAYLFYQDNYGYKKLTFNNNNLIEIALPNNLKFIFKTPTFYHPYEVKFLLKNGKKIDGWILISKHPDILMPSKKITTYTTLQDSDRNRLNPEDISKFKLRECSWLSLLKTSLGT